MLSKASLAAKGSQRPFDIDISPPYPEIQVIEVNTRFHDLIVEKCRNTSSQSFYSKTRTLGILSRVSEFRMLSKRRWIFVAEHEAILEAINMKDES
ncbi:MAG: FCD domain-containing protein [Desulfitobacteriia bacterium]